MSFFRRKKMFLLNSLSSSSLSVTAQFKGAAPLKKPSFQLGATQRFSFRLALFACASLNCCVIRFVFSLKKPPPCHLPAAATPHARRAHPTAKNFVFASGPPSYRPGEARGATSLELRPVVPLPSLAQTHMFFGFRAAQRLLTSLNGAASARHQPSPKGNPRLLSSTCCFGKTQRPFFSS